MSLLTYHSLDHSGSIVSVAPEMFAAQMAELQRLALRGISLREAVAHRRRFDGWPPDCVVLTLDDGYANVLNVALPILRRHGFTATVFVVSAHVGGINDWDTPPAGFGPQPMMSWSDLGELVACGIEIGSHTKRHPDLRRLGAEEIEAELSGSRADIEARLGVSVESFSYPFGGLSDTVIAAVRRHYGSAVTTVLKRAGGEPLHTLPRIDMYYVQSVDQLRRTLLAERDLYLGVRRWGRRLARLVRDDTGVHSRAFLSPDGKR